MDASSTPKKGFIVRSMDWVRNAIRFMSVGVWEKPDTYWYIRVAKVISLSVTSFLNKTLQSQAAALTYNTILAIVPALALVFAISRGFGFQNLLQTQLFNYFPAQREALETAFTFVDSYLNQASEGIFVGVGIVFLLWTLISLLTSIEQSFNSIWGVKQGRSMWRKLTDYTAIILLLPILMICASGINVFMSSTLQEKLPFEFISPFFSSMLDFASLVLTCLFFAGLYVLLPNTRVTFRNAILAGILAGVSFTILQWLFVSGTLYVSRYNAIYGSFAFLPLLLLWLQLVWIITLAGAVLCYSSQNISYFNFSNQVKEISAYYRFRVGLAIMTIIVQHFQDKKGPVLVEDFAREFNIPPMLVSASLIHLEESGLVNKVLVDPKREIFGFAPSIPITEITVGLVAEKLINRGNKDFLTDFDHRFTELNDDIRALADKVYKEGESTLLSSIKIYPNPINTETT